MAGQAFVSSGMNGLVLHRVCQRGGAVTPAGLNGVQHEQPKPTCKTRSRSTMKCRPMCCRKKREPIAEEGRQSKLFLHQERGVRHQLTNWRHQISVAAAGKHSSQSSQPGDQTPGSKPEADSSQRVGEPLHVGADCPKSGDSGNRNKQRPPLNVAVCAGCEDR